MSALCERSPDLSIIIPVYNLEHYIGPMLRSLKEQDTGDYLVEIIFVINNCTDNTEAVIRNSGLSCTILYCAQQGCGPARNTGLDAAKGEYIWTIDGDDWLLSNTAIKQILDRVKRDNLDILLIPFCHERYRANYFSMTCQYAMRREFIKEFRFPDYQPAEDDAFMDKVLRKAGHDRWNYLRLPKLENELYYYNYMRPGSNMFRVAHGERI